MTEHPRARLDDLFHQPVRFSLLAGMVQADGPETLEEAGYIAIRKGHVGTWRRAGLNLTLEPRTSRGMDARAGGRQHRRTGCRT